MIRVRDLSYAPVGTDRSPAQRLDIYHDRPGLRQPSRPIVVFVHGGGWTAGDKDCFGVDLKGSVPSWFVEHGFVFVSLNFSLPGGTLGSGVTIDDAATDVARALKWLTINGRRYGGDVKKLILVGFSSGSHLASLAVCDPRYLKNVRMETAHIRGVICMDAAQYDVPLAIAFLEKNENVLPNQRRALEFLKSLLGRLPVTQARWSPANYVGSHLLNSAFLLLSAGKDRSGGPSFSYRMSQVFCDRLCEAGIVVTHRYFEELKHTDFINKFDGPVSNEVTAFLDGLIDSAPI